MRIYGFLLAPLLLLITACIRPQNYHPGGPLPSQQSVQHLNYTSGGKLGSYFCDAEVDEAYVEFNAQGNPFDAGQLTRAVARIEELSKQPMLLMIFIHGWKNNASEGPGNVWGFRRMLNHQAWRIHQKYEHMPVMGVYLGWPGAASSVGQMLTFGNRLGVAETVGGKPVAETLTKLMQAAKGPKYDGTSSVVLIGHSFGGVVTDRAMLSNLNDMIDGLAPGESITPPADLTILLNEAGPSYEVKKFVERLHTLGVSYSTGARSSETKYPLIAAMTSDGDAATKLALPGGLLLSPDREKTVQFPKPDLFGQTNSLVYELQAAANVQALRSHTIVQSASCDHGIAIRGVHRKDYCMAPIAPPVPNQTPFWIMGLPQVFVPDHSSVFQNEMIELIGAFLAHRGLVDLASPGIPGYCVPANAKGRATVSAVASVAAKMSKESAPKKPTLRRTQ